MKQPPASPRTSSSRRSAGGWRRGRSSSASSCRLAGNGDDVTNASVAWPDDRQEVPFGAITLTERVDDQEPERRKIIFDPVPRVDGVDSSGDPLTEVRVGDLPAERTQAARRRCEVMGRGGTNGDRIWGGGRRGHGRVLFSAVPARG